MHKPGSALFQSSVDLLDKLSNESELFDSDNHEDSATSSVSSSLLLPLTSKKNFYSHKNHQTHYKT